ncbi:DUF1642 domain-containing protein [Enterococcus faecalis]|uniref:DUF1642 domain-containing protein n=1 Tax=Enterococcus faecalis TaxID=1351 RepID=UPI0006660342|nr:DUF1642 domain-containing protein [Enterococcus faecalis]DAF13313.1 MAG TPA: Protein of unknown function (DUF1642) [Caudoviricetes sp.]MDI7020755.1 DUF1642 domain-containing protein [Enterococcus faecalis]MDK8205454.1 DUF1642 domain-containing protein [Enterococcus faecalis]MDK8219009.1 DUF1642 domain-containing protein [Enterococcus faecalis]MDK8268046.1 DUF1642 domain-containing protein [Enterococcus faecalis]
MKNYYHVKTQEAYDSLMTILETLGYSWITGNKPTKIDIFHMLGAATVIEVDGKKKKLKYMETHTFKQIIEIDGVSLIEWPAVASKEKIEVSKEFDEWVQKSKEAHIDYKSWCIWQINKMGWGHWLEDPITDEMLFASEGSKWTKEVEENKELHTRAILDGYTVKKEPMYEIPLPYTVNATEKQQYLSYDTEKNHFVCAAKSDKLKHHFTEKELKEKVPEFYRELAVKVDE